MEQFFLQAAARSLSAIPFICAIIVLRSALKRIPRGYIYALWMLLLAELVFPFQLESPIGFLPQLRVLEQNIVRTDTLPAGNDRPDNGGNSRSEDSFYTVGWEDHGKVVSPMETTIEDGAYHIAAANEDNSGNEKNIPASNNNVSIGGHRFSSANNFLRMNREGSILLACAWLSGIVFLLGRNSLQLYRLKKKVAFAVKGEEVCVNRGNRAVVIRNIWETEGIESPFIFPGIRAKIYLPFGLGQREKEDILAHEHYHIHYMHPWIKWIASLILIVYWFNPFIWIAVKLMSHDMEMICDDAALKNRTEDDRRGYARTLLKYSMKSSGLQPCLAFGESGTSRRIEYLMNVKRPGRLKQLLFLLMIPLCFMGFLPAGSAAEASEGGVNSTGAVGSQVPGADATARQEMTGPQGAAGMQETVGPQGAAGMQETVGAQQTAVFENMDGKVPEQDAADQVQGYTEPELRCYIPDFYTENGYTNLDIMPEDRYEGLARQALRELYYLTGTEISECCYFYTDNGGFSFGLTEEDLEHGRDFYSRNFDANTDVQFWGIATTYIAYADEVWYSPVQQMIRPEGYASMTEKEKAVWLLEASGLYNDRAVADTYQPYDLDDTWRIVMDDKTAYEITLDPERGYATNISGPYPDENINH